MRTTERHHGTSTKSMKLTCACAFVRSTKRRERRGCTHGRDKEQVVDMVRVLTLQGRHRSGPTKSSGHRDIESSAAPWRTWLRTSGSPSPCMNGATGSPSFFSFAACDTRARTRQALTAVRRVEARQQELCSTIQARHKAATGRHDTGQTGPRRCVETNLLVEFARNALLPVLGDRRWEHCA